MNHPLLLKIKGFYEMNKEAEVLKDYATFLHDTAVISEGGKLDDPAKFNRMIADLAKGGVD